MRAAQSSGPAPLVLVTGATRGLGLAIARHLLEAGYRVVGSGRKSTPELEALQKQCEGSLSFMPLDLSDPARIHGFVRDLTGSHGHLYGLVNNAALGHDGVLATMHESQISELIRVNVEAAILMAKYCSRSMLLGRCGRIVNVSSIVAATGYAGLAVYGATKAALAGLTRSLARELGKAEITVNTLAPGYMETEMSSGLRGEMLEVIRRRSPLGRLTTVEDAAAAVVYLMSPEARSITGSTLTVDSGTTA